MAVRGLGVAVVVILATALLPLGSSLRPAVAAERSMTVAPGITVPYPAGWSQLLGGAANAFELINVPDDAQESSAAMTAARIMVMTEQRPDHAAALRSLREIAAEQKVLPTFLNIGGWPALQRRVRAPLGRRNSVDAGAPEGMALYLTTAIAAGDRVVRLQGNLAPGTPTSVADEIEAICRGTRFATQGDPAQVQREIDDLRRNPTLSHGSTGSVPTTASPDSLTDTAAESQPVAGGLVDTRSVRGAATAQAAAPNASAFVQNGVGEIEIAVSNNGQNVVIGANSGFANSTDGGQTFTFRGGTPGPNNSVDGDPSLAVGVSGNFYYGYIGFPDGTAAWNFQTGCSTGISRSLAANAGANFTFRGNAILCPNSGTGLCFPDQEHIAADRFNAATGGGDQLYSVWRQERPAPPAPANCASIGRGFFTPSIVCSTDGGTTWSSRLNIEAESAGDRPRVTVAQNGKVFVVYRTNANSIKVKRYDSCNNKVCMANTAQACTSNANCAAGDTCVLHEEAAGVVASNDATEVPPVPGLDRSANLSSQMIAVDDTNANHIYVAYAVNTAGNNDNIVVRDTTDTTLTTWSAPRQLNGGGIGRRYFPWVCSLGGAARVGWYDQRAGQAAGAARVDLTDYFCNSVSRSGANLVTGTEVNITQSPDPTCASGFQWLADAPGDSDSCPGQPVNAGLCCKVSLQATVPAPGSACPAGMGSNTPCDFDMPTACQTGEMCQVGGGCPKYGDYNGIACGAGRVFTSWSSATAPAGLPAVAGLTVFAASKLAGAAPDLAITKTDAPDPVIAGTNLTYTISVKNNGPATALGLVVSDTTPPNTTFVSALGGGFTCTPPAGGTGLISCTNPFLAIGATAVLTIVVRVSASAPNGSTISNTASVASSDPDPIGGNNSVTATTAVITRADLSVTKQDAPDPVIAGTELTYTVTTTNLGPSDAQDVVINDVIPATTRFLSAAPSAGGACTVPPLNGSGAVRCTYPGATTPTATHSVTIVVRSCSDVLCSAPITDTGTASSATIDPNPSNNDLSNPAGRATTTVQTQSDLSIAKVGPAGPVLPGGIVQYTLSVGNTGPSNSNVTTVVDAVPPQFDVLTTSPSQGSCSVSAAGTVTCNLGDLGAPNQCTAGSSATAKVVIIARVRATAQPGPVTETATVSSGNCLPDLNPDDNTASTTTLIGAASPQTETFLGEVEVVKDGAAGLDGATAVAISPDGKHVYVASKLDSSLAVFSRDPVTGRLTFVEVQTDGVGGVDGLGGADAVAVSPDGEHVYAAGFTDNALAVFARDPATGRLSFVEMQTDGVGGVDGLAGADSVAVSPDGAHVYAAGANDDAVAVFSRDATTGKLTFIEKQTDGVGGVNGLAGASSVAVHPSGRFVYVTGVNDNALAVFGRDAATGKLHFIQAQKNGVNGVDGLAGAASVAVSPNGLYVYVAAAIDDAVTVFRSDAATGRLTFIEIRKDGVDGVEGLDGAVSLVVSPDGADVYVASSEADAVAVFRTPHRVQVPLFSPEAFVLLILAVSILAARRLARHPRAA